MQMKKSDLWQILSLPQTYGLMLGVSLGYGMLVYWLGFGTLVLIPGGIISLGTLCLWFWQIYPLPVAATLLNQSTFQTHLAQFKLGPSVSAQQHPWPQVCQQARESQAFAAQIAAQEPSLIPDLLEALHTVLALVEKVGQTLQALDTVQSTSYRQLAGEFLVANGFVARIPESLV